MLNFEPPRRSKINAPPSGLSDLPTGSEALVLRLDVLRGPISFDLVVRNLPHLLLILEIAMLLLVFLLRQLLLVVRIMPFFARSGRSGWSWVVQDGVVDGSGRCWFSRPSSGESE